jgi:hypothetical protein
MVNKENFQKLIDALRSGEYAQGKMALRTTQNEFCCMGVACDIYQKEVGDLDVKVESEAYTYDDLNGYMPLKVAEWYMGKIDSNYIGLSGSNTTGTPYVSLISNVNNGTRDISYAGLNDSYDYDFNQIANVMENQYIKEIANDNI